MTWKNKSHLYEKLSYDMSENNPIDLEVRERKYKPSNFIESKVIL